jgi:uncharacterized membrane protein YqjE
VGLAVEKRMSFFLRGNMMLMAVLLNAVLFVRVMEPSPLSLRQFVLNDPVNRISVVAVLHGILEVLAEVLGIWTVVSSRLQSPSQYCTRRRKE